MSQALRKLTGTISKTNTVCIFINQLRDKVGITYGSPEVTTGGNALKFYATIRIDIRKGQAIKDGDDVLGSHAKVKVVKNKVAPPFRKAEFDIVYGEGISRIGEILDIATDENIIVKSGAWFSYDGKKLGQGRENVKIALEADPELLAEIEAKVIAAYDKSMDESDGKKKVKAKGVVDKADDDAEPDMEEIVGRVSLLSFRFLLILFGLPVVNIGCRISRSIFDVKYCYGAISIVIALFLLLISGNFLRRVLCFR